jgi:DNA invertase Pin-like site-specific DNA recombinase
LTPRQLAKTIDASYGPLYIDRQRELGRAIRTTSMKLFERRHVALVSLQESLDATTTTGWLMRNLLASVSQWEREVIGERTRDAMQHLKA